MQPIFHILHVAETAQGGVGTYLEEIVPLQEARHGAGSTRVLVPTEHAQALPGLAGPWLHTFSNVGGRFRASIRLVSAAVRAVRAWRPDVVHVHSTYAGFFVRALFAFWPGSPAVVYCAHGWAFDRRGSRTRNRVIALVERLLSYVCGAIVCVSDRDCERAREVGIAADKLCVVRNGIADLPLADPTLPKSAAEWTCTGLRVLFVGRLDEQKGVDVFFDAMRHVGDRACAVVVGASVVAHGQAVPEVPSNVQLAGWRSRAQIADLYRCAEVLVMASRWEGLPLVALEAMRAGLPVIATRVGGIPEAVEHARTGLLVDSENSEQLARAILSLDKMQLREMGQEARWRFDRLFRVERVVEELDNVYARVLPQPERWRAVRPEDRP